MAETVIAELTPMGEGGGGKLIINTVNFIRKLGNCVPANFLLPCQVNPMARRGSREDLAEELGMASYRGGSPSFFFIPNIIFKAQV